MLDLNCEWLFVIFLNTVYVLNGSAQPPITFLYNSLQTFKAGGAVYSAISNVPLESMNSTEYNTQLYWKKDTSLSWCERP